MIGLLRIKNESRWVERVIRALWPACDRILVFDDHSTDGTPDICKGLGCVVYHSPFVGLDEGRDKDFLLAKVWESCAQIGDWCLMVDGDEALYQEDIPSLRAITAMSAHHCYSMHIVYLWDREDQIRVDRWYREFRRPSMFRLTSRALSFRRTGYGGNFHCSSAPVQLLDYVVPAPVRLLHYGYMNREDRIKKYYWYNEIDGDDPNEDGYKHMVVGDIFPASSQFRWAGPLELRPL